MMEFTFYHKILRISSLVLAITLLFQSGIVSDATAKMSLQTQYYVANSVGVSVGVAPTDLNKITAGLTAKELALDAREKALHEREINVGLSDSSLVTKDTTTFILGLMLFILLLLILLNYALDYLRYRERAVLSRGVRT